MNNNIVYGGKLNKTVPPVENHKHHKAVFVALFGIIFLTSGFGVPTFLEGTMILCGCSGGGVEILTGSPLRPTR